MTVTVRATGIEVSPELMFRGDLQTKSLTLPPQTTYLAGQRRMTVFKRYRQSDLKKKLKFLNAKQFEAISFNKQGELPFHSDTPGKVHQSEGGKILTPGKFGPVEFHHEHMIDRSIKRLITKIAFNYFAKCALPAFDTIVYGQDFDALRKFVLLDDSEFGAQFGMERTLIGNNIEKVPIRFNATNIAPGQPFHLFRLACELVYCNGIPGAPAAYYPTITCLVNLFSLYNYKVQLCINPFRILKHTNFGCAHVFDIAARQWIRVDERGIPAPPNDFGLVS